MAGHQLPKTDPLPHLAALSAPDASPVPSDSSCPQPEEDGDQAAVTKRPVDGVGDGTGWETSGRAAAARDTTRGLGGEEGRGGWGAEAAVGWRLGFW